MTLMTRLMITWTRREESRSSPLVAGTKPTSRDHPIFRAFNTNAIIYDNTPWKPGNEADVQRAVTDDVERKLNNLATRIMSNGVEVLVKDKNTDAKYEQRTIKLMHQPPMKPSYHAGAASKQTLLSSAVATVIKHQQISALLPLNKLMKHNYIIKTCMTTYTYLTTIIQNKRSAISTFDTIVSVVTTESLTNLYATDDLLDLKPTKTKYMEVKTIQPSSPTKMYMSNFPKADKRIDSNIDDHIPFDLIQPSEVNHAPCTTTSCSCSHTKTESLKTKYPNRDASLTSSMYNMKTSKYGELDLRPTNKDQMDKKTQYSPYEYETNSQLAPTDRIVEKYTEVINDYSDEKDPSPLNESELLTNEQAPAPPKINKTNNKLPEKGKPDKQKPNKNKFVVADLLKLGTLGIKGLTQLAPVIEKMTGGFIKRQDAANKITTTTINPAVKLTAYNVDKRVDSDLDSKHSNFPIYIPVDELETSESQIVFTNATLHQNLVWAAEHKQPKAHIVPPKIIHESPLVNGGIPISPGEIITANSDVIVGKPAVGGPLTLAASGIKLQNPVSPPVDSFVAANEQYLINEKPLSDQGMLDSKVDDSYDLRPPELPKMKPKPNRPLNAQRPSIPVFGYQNNVPHRLPPTHVNNEQLMKTEHIQSTTMLLGNHGRPAFLDYIPSLAKPTNTKHYTDFHLGNKGNKDSEIHDNSPSSSEIVNTQIRTEDNYHIAVNSASNKPFLVDIQPSRVANVLIPHGSSTALVFAGSSEPHKSGDYVDDPLPYPEPGYFGSFSIDAPQMTNVHANVAPNNNKQLIGKPNINGPHDHYKPNIPTYKEHNIRNDLKLKWKDNKRPGDYNKIPPPTSNQETHVQVGPQITSYNPDIFSPTNGGFDKYNQVRGNDKPKDGKKIIDKEYENYLSVPPPPPKMVYNQENSYDKLKPYQQRPIVHTKPVQDMKVFLNIQHPVPQEQQLPKVTSEIYFAAQAPSSKPSPTYTIHIPPTINSFANTYNKPTNNAVSKPANTNIEQTQVHFPIVPSPNMVNNSQIKHNNNEKENTFTVTLNTATNVANNVGDVSQVIGSSVPVPIGSSNVGLNTDIPIGTNFAIRVEDNRPSLETYNLQGQRKPIIYDENVRVPIEVSVEDNRWNQSSIEKEETTIVGHNYYDHNVNTPPPKVFGGPILPPSLNSHANFPMINEDAVSPTKASKPVEYVDDVKFTDQKRPAKLIPNIPTNSHGWYSSVLNENNINNIKVEVTTRKIIPIHEYNERDSLPDFGQKITSVGKPPTEIWSQTRPVLPDFNVGKPFTKTSITETPYSSIPPLTTKSYANNYIPSNLNAMQQPAYDIPIRDNSDETTTSTQKPKPVYENSEEVYDGEEEQESTYDNDGAVSLESMKIPVVSSSSEIGSSISSTEITLLQDEILSPSKEIKNTNTIVNFNPGTQTEKPYGIFNKTSFQSNTMKPVYKNSYYNMKPRPFTVNTAMVLDHQLQQPHWQINHMMENSSNASYEDNIDLNIGEEMNIPSTTKPSSTQRLPISHSETDDKYKTSFRPVFTRTNNTQVLNESNIITSTVHIKDKKPLIVEKATEKPTFPTFTIKNDIELNRTSSEIIDLSPPPPTMDYSFKPSTNDEMIMGMSPPPPRNPPANRPPPRVPMTPRPIPVRTPPPYRPKPQRTLPPRIPTQRPVRKPVNRDEISTFRPIRDESFTHRPLKDEVSTYRPPIRDEISTYRPAYDILHNIRRPALNRDQPSSQLLPPPRETPSKVITPVTELSSPTFSHAPGPNLVFPTPTSSGWLTSSGIEFSSSFNFAPTSIHFPETPKPSTIPDLSDITSSENSYSYEVEYSSERNDDITSGKPSTEYNLTSKEVTDSTPKTTSSSTETIMNDSLDSIADESVEDATTDKIKIVSHKNRTRKPYPIRHDDKKATTSKFRLPPKPTSIIRPTRTLVRPDIVYPTRQTSTKKIVRPTTSRLPPVISSSIIESSESTIDEDLIKPTEVLIDSVRPMTQIEISDILEPSPTSITPTLQVNISPIIQPVHHAGNEVKISDEPIPTKTEFRTTVVTSTKTLSEPPTTISTVDYVNLTHTLTVTHTKTSLVSQSEGAVTETLVLTNTQTSTIVDVVTEIRTQVQPTTIIETVTKHIPVSQVEPTPVQEIKDKTKAPLDDISMSSEENENLIIRDNEVTENVQKIEVEGEGDNDTFFVVMNKSQNGGLSQPVNTEVETGDYDGITRNEQVNSNGVSQVLFGEILLAGAPYLETTNVGGANGYGKECHPDCKASRNERCQRIDGIMKCVCRPGFARMFPDRPCKPTYTYSVKLALDSQGNRRLRFQQDLSDNSSKEYQALAVASHEGINRMVMQSDLRDVFHGVHITGFHPVEMKETGGDLYQGVMNDFYVQLSDNAHESRLKEVIEKYLRNNNYSLGGTDVHAAGELVDRLEVSDFDECTSVQFHDCSEHAQCFNLRGTYTCSCLEGYADLSVNTLYPGRICSTEPVGCERCNYHGACYSRDDRRVLCECFQWYAGSTCQINLKVVLISLVVAGAVLTAVLTACAVVACRRSRPPQRSIVACIQSMPALHQGTMPSKQRADRRALISERGDAADASSIQNASLPYMPVKRPSSTKKIIMSEPPAHDPPPPPAPAVMIPRARLHPHHGDSRENISRKRSLEMSSEAKLISYLESGASANKEEMRRKHSLESSYSANKDRHNKQGALVSAGFKVSTTIRADEMNMKDDRDDLSSINKESDGDMGRFDSLRKSYSQEDLSEWTDAERRLGELTLSEARSVGGTLPASTGRAASSTRLTHQEANTMAERDLGSTFLLPHVHLYKPDLTSDVSEFDSL